jgi:hypothetical protein
MFVGQSPLTCIGTELNLELSAGDVIIAGSVTNGAETLAVTKISLAPLLKVQPTKKTPAHTSRKIISGYGKNSRLGRFLDVRTERFLVFWRAIFVLIVNT